MQPTLRSVTRGTSGLDWHPILEWTTQRVFEYLEQKRFALHEAYEIYGSSRVSCCFCILSSLSDMVAAARCEANHEVYRALVRLEIRSTFPFQPTRWLGDVAPHLLDTEDRSALDLAKERARRRCAAESRIPEHLLFTEGWPRSVPTQAEALLLCDVRRTVAGAAGIAVDYTEPERLVQRYKDLLTEADRCQHRHGRRSRCAHRCHTDVSPNNCRIELWQRGERLTGVQDRGRRTGVERRLTARAASSGRPSNRRIPSTACPNDN